MAGEGRAAMSARIMVDDLIVWPNGKGFWKGRPSCHLTTDGPIDDLHAFAQRIGLRRSWFQEHRLMPHYDLTEARRDAALRAGAVYVSGREQAIARRAARKAAE